jgi:ABC-type glycerol-3-phosphate transport system substrate-binding protein
MIAYHLKNADGKVVACINGFPPEIEAVLLAAGYTVADVTWEEAIAFEEETNERESKGGADIVTTYIMKKGEKVIAIVNAEYDFDEGGASFFDGMTTEVATPEEIRAFEAAGGVITPIKD